MAQTKAKATYAVTTLSLLTKGLTVIAGAPLDSRRAPALNSKVSKAFPAEKVSGAVHPAPLHRACAAATWLKIRKNNALKSL
jgi:hypothetical protein